MNVEGRVAILTDFFSNRLLLKRFRKDQREALWVPEDVTCCEREFEALAREISSLEADSPPADAVEWAERCAAFSEKWLETCHWLSPRKFREFLTLKLGTRWCREEDVPPGLELPPVDLKWYKNPSGASPVQPRVCSLCNVVCNSEAQFQAHCQGKTHRALERQQYEQQQAMQYYDYYYYCHYPQPYLACPPPFTLPFVPSHSEPTGPSGSCCSSRSSGEASGDVSVSDEVRCEVDKLTFALTAIAESGGVEGGQQAAAAAEHLLQCGENREGRLLPLLATLFADIALGAPAVEGAAAVGGRAAWLITRCGPFKNALSAELEAKLVEEGLREEEEAEEHPDHNTHHRLRCLLHFSAESSPQHLPYAVRRVCNRPSLDPTELLSVAAVLAPLPPASSEALQIRETLRSTLACTWAPKRVRTALEPLL